MYRLLFATKYMDGTVSAVFGISSEEYMSVTHCMQGTYDELRADILNAAVTDSVFWEQVSTNGIRQVFDPGKDW